VSRIGKKPIKLPNGVKFSLTNNLAVVTGPKGELTRELPEGISIEATEDMINVLRADDSKQMRAFHGLSRALINNMVTGVSEGFTKELILFGVGFKMEIKGNYLILNLGYSHPIYFKIPECITIEATQPINNTSSIKMSGIDKELVGLIADKIRSFKKPEPYKGKGLRYSDEVIIRKAGKTAKK